MSTGTLSKSKSGQCRYRVGSLIDTLPHPSETWRYGDTDLSWSDFRWASQNDLLVEVRNGDPSVYRTKTELADTVEHYVDMYDIHHSGDGPLATLD